MRCVACGSAYRMIVRLAMRRELPPLPNARHRAEQLARLHDVQLGRVLRIAERDTGGARPEGMMIRMADASVHTPVSVGDLSFRSGIEVIYELKD